MVVQKSKQIIDLLLEKGLIELQKIESYKQKAKESGQALDEFIFRNKIIEEEDYIQTKAEFLKVPYVDLRGEKIPPNVLKEIPEEAATHYRFVPFFKHGKQIDIAMLNPKDIRSLEALKFIALRHNLKTRIFITSPSSFEGTLRQYRVLGLEVSEALKGIKKDLKIKKPVSKKEKVGKVERLVEKTPVSKIVDIIIRHAYEGGASDIHIEPMETDLRVRFRVDGVLHSSLILPKQVCSGVISRIKILTNLKIDESRKPQDGRFHMDIDGKGLDFRVSTLPTLNGEKAALRILDKSIGLRNLHDLGLEGNAHDITIESIKKPYGMILITGPTGSGKSTTLYALLSILNQEGVNIITLEDPIEYDIEGVNQSQIRPEIGYSFASGLRTILRQDPDVIMVGEIRDKETARLAVHAALTGHIVLSTLHTNDAVGVIPRLVDMGIDPFLITSSLNLIIAQRLVRKICKYCRKEIEPDRGVKEIIERQVNKLSQEQKDSLSIKKPYKIYQGKGCKYCNNQGEKGRIAVFEVFSMTPNLEKIIIENLTESAIREETQRQKMLTMLQDGIIKVLKGTTTINEVIKVTKD